MTADLIDRVRTRLSDLPLDDAVELAARFGYGARGFVYLSAGILTLLAATDHIGSAVGSSGASRAIATARSASAAMVRSEMSEAETQA